MDMSEETPAATTAPATYSPLAPNARSAYNWLLYGALSMAALALLLLFVSFSGGAFEPAMLGGVALVAAAPLFAGAGVVAGLGKRETE